MKTAKEMLYAKCEEKKGCFLSGQVAWIVEAMEEYKNQFAPKKERSRTYWQNKYYFSVIEVIADYIGETKERTHEIFKAMFLTRDVVNEKTDKIFQVVKSTTDLSIEDFSKYIKQVKTFAETELLLTISEPKEIL